MKDFYIADAARFENQPVTTFFCIGSLSVRDRKPSGQYLALTLVDKTGQFEARMWEDFADAILHCSAGCYVKVQGNRLEISGQVPDHPHQASPRRRRRGRYRRLRPHHPVRCPHHGRGAPRLRRRLQKSVPPRPRPRLP